MPKQGQSTKKDNKDKKDFEGSGVEGKKADAEAEVKERRIKHIVGVLPALNFPEDFTADQKPRVKAIEEKLGFDITQEERDAATEIIRGQNADFPKSFKVEKEKGYITIEDVLKRGDK